MGIELMPAALEAEQKRLVILTFFLGSLFFIILNRGIDNESNGFGGKGTSSAYIAIYIGVSIDLFTDGS